MGALMIYDPDLQVYTLQGYKWACQTTDDWSSVYYQLLWTS